LTTSLLSSFLDAGQPLLSLHRFSVPGQRPWRLVTVERVGLRRPYANLAGELDAQAQQIVGSMTTAGVQRLIFVTALGIYDEGPGRVGEWNRRKIGPMLGPYRAAADTIRSPDWTTPSFESGREQARHGG
jgi:hypothetical protein